MPTKSSWTNRVSIVQEISGNASQIDATNFLRSSGPADGKLDR